MKPTTSGGPNGVARAYWAEVFSGLKSDPEVTAKLKPAQIEECFDLGYHTKHVDTIFARVFGS